jgi:hypothetical protein
LDDNDDTAIRRNAFAQQWDSNSDKEDGGQGPRGFRLSGIEQIDLLTAKASQWSSDSDRSGYDDTNQPRRVEGNKQSQSDSAGLLDAITLDNTTAPPPVASVTLRTANAALTTMDGFSQKWDSDSDKEIDDEGVSAIKAKTHISATLASEETLWSSDSDRDDGKIQWASGAGRVSSVREFDWSSDSDADVEESNLPESMSGLIHIPVSVSSASVSNNAVESEWSDSDSGPDDKEIVGETVVRQPTSAASNLPVSVSDNSAESACLDSYYAEPTSCVGDEDRESERTGLFACNPANEGTGTADSGTDAQNAKPSSNASPISDCDKLLDEPIAGRSHVVNGHRLGIGSEEEEVPVVRSLIVPMGSRIPGKYFDIDSSDDDDIEEDKIAVVRAISRVYKAIPITPMSLRPKIGGRISVLTAPVINNSHISQEPVTESSTSDT